MSGLIVMKFGGSSVATSKNIARVSDIILSYYDRKIVVVISALEGVTDSLASIAATARKGDLSPVMSFTKELLKRHQQILNEVVADEEVKKEVYKAVLDRMQELENILVGIAYIKELTKRSMDRILSFGEQLSVLLIYGSLRSKGISCRWLTGGEAGITTDSNFGEANPLMEITSHQVRSRIIPLLDKHKIVIVTGFIAQNQDGEITTLGRGGSDYTATILASALGADEVLIWTDVDGIMTADPKIVPEAKIVPHLSYQEAIESAVFGAKKMHPKALEPAMISNIKVAIKNVFNPSASGTVISVESENGKPIKLVNLVKNVALVNVRGGGMVGAPGTAAKVFQTVAKNGINILMISQSVSESDISFVIKREDLSKARSSLEISLLGTGIVREISKEDDICVISVVGTAIKDTPGVASRLFSALAKENINIRMIAQGSSELNISFVVKERDCERAVRSIHKEFALHV